MVLEYYPSLTDDKAAGARLTLYVINNHTYDLNQCTSKDCIHNHIAIFLCLTLVLLSNVYVLLSTENNV